MKLKIPTQKEVEEMDSKERHCEKCRVSEQKRSISYITGLCDKCFDSLSPDSGKEARK